MVGQEENEIGHNVGVQVGGVELDQVDGEGQHLLAVRPLLSALFQHVQQ